MPRRTSPHQIRAAARALIGPGAIAVPDLVEQLHADGLTLGRSPHDRVGEALDDDPDFCELADGRRVFLPALVADVTWVAEVPPDLDDPDCVPAQPSLTLLETLAFDVPLLLAGSDEFAMSDELDDGTPVLHGPEGWLAHLTDGLGAFTFADDTLTVAATRRPGPHPAIATALTAAFDAHATVAVIDSDFDPEPVTLRFMGLDQLVAEALVGWRDGFLDGPVAPIDDLLAEAGLAWYGDDVLDAATDPVDLDRWRVRRQLASFHGLEGSEVDEAETVLTASMGLMEGALRLEDFDTGDDGARSVEELASTGAPAAALALALCLAKPAVARAFVSWHRGIETPPDDVERFARLLIEQLASPEDVGVRFVLASALDQQGDAAAAEAELEAALSTGIDHAPVLRMLAGYRSDRGDATGALALLHRIPDRDEAADGAIDELRDEVEPYARTRPVPLAGRNDPCPCGSGRKYKVCHLGTERLPLADRAPWLFAKAHRFLRDSLWRALIGDLAREIGQQADADHEMLLELLAHPLTADIALHEGGGFADFLAARDALLPDDEALTAARWSLVDRSVFELEAKTDDTLTLRDLRSGEHVTVTNVTPSEGTRVGDLLIARPLPVDDEWRAFGGVLLMPDALRDLALTVLDGDTDPFDVASLVGRCFAPPEVRHANGEVIVFHELVYDVADPQAAAAALAANPDVHDHGDGTFAWVEPTDGPGDRVVASFHIDGNDLRIDASSDERAIAAELLVEALLPDAIPLDHDRRTLAEALADRDAEDDDGTDTDTDADGSAFDPDDPLVVEALRQYMDAYEAQWVDEPVPALRGLTPRQAIDDPTVRPDLDRLLADMERRFRSAGGQGMDAARVRRRLGL